MAAICGKSSPNNNVSELELISALNAMQLRGGTSRDIGFQKNFGMGLTYNRELQDGDYLRVDELDTWLAYDGKIYNIKALAKKFHIQFPRDLQILAGLYRELGADLFPLLEGSFALAIWDTRNKIAVLVRDHIGTKPLFYSIHKKEIAFASAVAGLVPLIDRDLSLNLHGLDTYLTFAYIIAPETLLHEVEQVPPASCITIAADGTVKRQKYSLPYGKTFEKDSFEELSLALKKLLADTVAKHFYENDSPGFLLSGGVDTAALLGAAEKKSIKRPETFTLGFPESAKLDERRDARATAGHFDTTHHEIEVDHTCIDGLDSMTRNIGFPLAEPTSIILHDLFQEVGQKKNSVMVADGGNEIFGGTYKYGQVLHYISNLKHPRSRVKKLVMSLGHKTFYLIMDSPLDFVFQQMARQYFKKVTDFSDANALRLDEEQFRKTSRYYGDIVSIWSPENKHQLYEKKLKTQLQDTDPFKPLISLFNIHDDWELPQQLPYVRTYSYIPHMVIPFLEFNAVSSGVFPLFPLLDRKLMEFMFRIPYELVYGMGYRYFMEKSLSDVFVPSRVFRRPHKGFRAPIELWLKTPKWQEIVNDYLSEKSIRERGLFCPLYVREILDKYNLGKTFLGNTRHGRSQPISLTIWSLLALESWFRAFL